ncbi:histidinol-phosphate transaminase [Protaetiibacter intestinalis]|uniref:Histidinol-phosphate aminotransferase n=1 Tax=Protaetiibacter intestinalis TaxID=2419774 RepID=A0A387B2P7_9MICO|nr:histidinol-phosphate transaminase [Protaetiibacter intestinalis]AYF97792.1 aminotransferase class I/II-fold pyridoxal phosphate-dependent enzyme [Protaetiibacter intestinalis]
MPVVLRPEIAALDPYRQGRAAPADAFKLSSNESPFPTLPAVLDAVAASELPRYPDGSAAGLRVRLAERFGVTVDEVHVGAGSVSILHQLAQATSGPGDEILYAWRSFEAYPGIVTVSGATSVTVPNLPDGSHDLPAMAAAVTDRTRLILVCTPNNPTSAVVTAEAFEAFMDSVPDTVLVVLDEAYREFVTDPDAVEGIPLLERYPNLVVLRTFSKAYGLAGLRVGYAIGPSYVLDAARATAIALSVTEPAQRAALAALDHEAEYAAQVAELTARRDEIRDALRAQGWNIPEPQGNFVWLPTGQHTAAAAQLLEEHGIVARVFAPEGIRVTVGEAESVAPLIGAAEKVVRTL